MSPDDMQRFEITDEMVHDAGEDPWRIEEWKALPDECLISACTGSDIDKRGPVWLRDGSMHKACSEHWEAIFRILGEQATWERTDGSRQGGDR